MPVVGLFVIVADHVARNISPGGGGHGAIGLDEAEILVDRALKRFES
jgi:hypothetical protein